MTSFKLTGGIRIGFKNASYPFAVLKADKNKLELNASIMGNLVFQPDDIVSLESYSAFSFSKGIKIIHKVKEYNETVIFWTLKNPEWVIRQINATGFSDNIDNIPISLSKEIIQQQKQGGFPLKKSHAIAIIVLWNLLFITDVIRFIMSGGNTFHFGYGIIAALGVVFCSAFLLIVSSDFRKFMLKEGRGLDDVKRLSIFIMSVTGFLMIDFMILSMLL